jgi:Flp pilus assembly protein CpaB
VAGFEAAELPPARRASGALWFGLVSLLCALGAAWLAVRLVTAARALTVVWVAERYVAPLTPVAMGDVREVRLPVAGVPAGALTAPDEFAGQYARAGLVPGEVLTRQALTAGVAQGSAFDLQLASLAGSGRCDRGSPPPAGEAPGGGAPACAPLVAMALPLDADGGYTIVQPGDRVDLLAAFGGASGTESQVVAADVPVMAKLDGAPEGPGAPASSGWLVLAVNPAEAQEIQAAQSAGRVAAVLVPPGEDQAGLAGQTLTLGGGGSALPAVAGSLPAGGR